MSGVEITELQRERMRKNRERALELQERKRKEREQEEKEKSSPVATPNAVEGEKKWKRQRTPVGDGGDGTTEEEENNGLELEEFEVGASEYVTKKEAMKMYLLPEGTLNVCKFIEKENPRHKGWTAMKLYDRAELRRRARERWGGLKGLMEERRRREDKRFRSDLEKTKNMFNS